MTDYLQVLKELGVQVQYHGGGYPTQVHATIGDDHLYFRARWGEWECAIDATKERAIHQLTEGALMNVSGQDVSNGAMDEAHYMPLLIKIVRLYLAMTKANEAYFEAVNANSQSKQSPMKLMWLHDGLWYDNHGSYTFEGAQTYLQAKIDATHPNAPKLVWTHLGMYMTGDDADGKQWAQIEPDNRGQDDDF